jgi:hypothetical protein
MRMTLVLTAVLMFAAVGEAQQLCPCVPLTHEWIASACDSWDCATSAVVLANGDRNMVVPMPTTSSDYAWVILRRVVVGSAIVSPDAPFRVDGFDSLAVASSHYYSVDRELQPILLTAPDGKVLVVARTAPEGRRRPAAH